MASWDVAVVGGGGAGMAAAIEAADHGARVLLLEAADTAGGIRALIALAEEITEPGFFAQTGDFATFYLDRSLAHLARAQRQGKLASGDEQRCSRLEQTIQDLRAEAAFQSELEALWLPALRAPPPSEKGSPHHLFRGNPHDPRLLVYRRHRAASDVSLPERPLHCLEQPGVLKRLHDKISRARLQSGDHQFLLIHSAAHYDARVGVALHDRLHGVYAVHFRHHNIHRHHVRREFLVLCYGLHTSSGLAHDLEAGVVEHLFDLLPHEHRVITYENRMSHSNSSLRH